MTPSALLELVDLIYNSYKRGQSLIKLNRFINYTKQNKHKSLRPPSQVQMYPPVGPCRALPSQHSVGPMGNGLVEVEVEAGLPHTPDCC